MNNLSIPQLERSGQAPLPLLPLLPAKRKAQLVNLGLAWLSHGEWAMVAAITRLIQERGWRHV